MVGDGEAETGPLATAWHSNKFLNPARDGAVLPVLHLNGYKINNPSILARISRRELEALFEGYGYTPYFVEGSEPNSMHQALAATLEHCVGEIRAIQEEARQVGVVRRPAWPMVVLRSPKGWTAPREVDGHYLEGYWRSHQVPMGDVRENPAHLEVLEHWLRSYRPESLFDEAGRLIPELRDLPPEGPRRISANPAANGGLIRKPLHIPDFRGYGVEVKQPGGSRGRADQAPRQPPPRHRPAQPRRTSGCSAPTRRPRTGSRRRSRSPGKAWMGETFPEDADGGLLSPDGRVMEMLSEHTLEGWLEGYLLTGRHGFFSTYEAFAHVIDSMVNQHCKWLQKSNEVPWRAKVSSLNLLITSTVWRQDHNGFSHQDPGLLDVVANKSPEVVRVYLPPDANCLLSVGDHCLRSTGYVNVIVADKQPHLQYLDMDAAIRHCTKGIGIWDWASNDQGAEPDVVMASCGDVATMEALAATELLREHFPGLKVRFVNVVDLARLVPEREHSHGLSDREFESLFTPDRPVIFNFHSYPWLIHRLTYRRRNQHRIHVRGYKEQGNINTPMELAICNQIDRFSLAIDAIDRVPALATVGAHARERLLDRQLQCRAYAFEHGVDQPEVVRWTWKGAAQA